MNTFAIIVAVDQKKGIGKSGQLPWHLPEDLKHFKTITTRTTQARRQNAVIMGRKTWESIPEKFRPLPGRLNVVVTSQNDYPLPLGVLKRESLRGALEAMAHSSIADEVEDVFVIGGAQVFNEAITYPECRKLFLTTIERSFDCDVFFPSVPPDFKESFRSPVMVENTLPFYFSEWHRK